MNNLEQIRDDVIKKGFPELMAIDIQIEYSRLWSFMEVGELTGEGFFIEVDELSKEVPKEVTEGGIAHELAHIIAMIRMKSAKILFLHWFLKRFSREYRRPNERNTDLEVITRGFGKQLLALSRYTEEQRYDYYEQAGLSTREIEALLRQQNKK